MLIHLVGMLYVPCSSGIGTSNYLCMLSTDQVYGGEKLNGMASKDLLTQCRLLSRQIYDMAVFGRVTCVESMFLLSVTHCQISALWWKA